MVRPTHLALGGAWYAERLDSGSTGEVVIGEDDVTAWASGPAAVDPPPVPPADPPPVGLSPALAQRLMSEGRMEEAHAVLAELDRQVAELRRQLPPPKSILGQESLRRADALLAAGRYEEAVEQAHLAQHYAPADVAVFDRMMAVHAEAGEKLSQPEEYQRAVRILTCAHNHDQTNKRVHEALAQRHFLHATELRRRNNPALALDLLNLALKFDPKHAQGNDLLRVLLQETPADRPVEGASRP